MKRKVIEQSVLFISILKWIFLATCAGIVVGLSTSLFLKALGLGIAFAKGYQYYYLFLPVAFLLSMLLVKYLAPEAAGHGTEKVIEAVHKKSGRMNPLVVPVKLAATVITIAAGGSAGKEGPCAQIGAGACSAIADLLKFDDRDRKKLVICGISAGFATVFGTPIAGAIFGVEVLFVGGLLYDVLLPSFVAGIVGFHVSSALGITYFQNTLSSVPVFSSPLFLEVCLSGLFFGLCSLLFIEIIRFFERRNNSLNIWGPVKGLIGGSILVVLVLLFSTRYLGLGLDGIKSAVAGNSIPPEAFFLKMLFTAITLSFGGSGGIITPIFFIGATAGNVFGSAFGLDAAFFAAVGMVGLLAGAANTPISASIMAIELFGPGIGTYAAVACVISFLMTGHRSVYPSQILSFSKSTSLTLEKDREIRDLEGVDLQLRPKSISGILMKIVGHRKDNK